MRVIEGTTTFELQEPTAIAIGKFDGIHRGHRELLAQVQKAKEQGLRAAVFTFDPSPETFFKKRKRKELMTRAEKRACFEQLGMDDLVEYPFNEKTAGVMPEDYVKDFLLGQMHGRLIVAGEDLSFGYQGAGDAGLLREMAREHHFEVRIISKICEDGREISSTFVREEVRRGHMEKAAQLLGKPYAVSGIISTGNQIGRTMGLPTLNLYPPEEKLLPPNGVYFAKAQLDGKEYQGVTNIGCKPTIGKGQPMSVETHLFDFDGNAYGKFCEVRLLRFDRPERKFDSVTQLKQAILDNVLHAKEYFARV
ncbi:MAG: bifunctional riboflavin kinase/FAD synthetase [Lachnospiraceae bacterium]|nr:bifunctional riboflavin kinase/FAD synthetase [Lachnospiraceae bacterium]